MGDYFGMVGEQLMRLCDQGAHGRRWRRDLASRKVWPALGLAASVAVVVAVVGVVLWAGGVSTPGGTTPGSPHSTLTAAQQKRVSQIAYRILRSTGPACIRNTRLSIKNAMLSISNGAPDHAVLSTLGVLRRSATAADTVSRLASRPILRQAHGIYVRYVRLARTFGGADYYLVPAADVGGATAGCIATYRRRLRNAHSHIPPPLGAAVRSDVQGTIARIAPHEGVMLFSVYPGGGTGSAGDSIRQIRMQGGDFGIFGGSGRVSQLTGIIPDGVATVTLSFPRPGSGSPIVVTARPVGNLLVVPVPSASSRFPASMVWRAPNGRLIRTIRRFGSF